MYWSSDDETAGNNEHDLPSLDSDVTSPRNSEPTSLTESMQIVDNILNDSRIDRLDKIDRLEAVLSHAAALENNVLPETSEIRSDYIF